MCDIVSGNIAEMHRRICHVLHGVHLAARMPRAFLNKNQFSLGADNEQDNEHYKHKKRI